MNKNTPGIYANLILVVLMSSSISQALYTSLFMTGSLSPTVFIAAAVITLLLYVIFYNTKTQIVSAIIFILALITSILYILFAAGANRAIEWSISYTNWLFDIGNGYMDTSSLLYNNITVIVIVFLITLCIFLFTVKKYNFYIICIFTLSIFFTQLQFRFFSSKTAFSLFIFAFLLYYFFDILRRRSKDLSYDAGNSLKYLLFITPVCIIIIAVSFLFPVRNDRISWPWLDNKVDTAINSAVKNISDRLSGDDIADFNYFSIQSTGFGSSDRLGGNIGLNNTHVMDVKTTYPNLYMKASSKAFYNGHGWYDDNPEFTPIRSNHLSTTYSRQISADNNEMLFGNQLISGAYNNDIFRAAKVEIEYADISTKSLFIPLKTYLLTLNKPLNIFYDNEQMISANEVQNKSFKYTLNYNNILLDSDEFKENIRKSYKGYYTANIGVYAINNYNSLRQNRYRLAGNNRIAAAEIAELRENLDAIYSRYTILPDTITGRVRQLAEELTKDEDNNYDKAKAIEIYLSNNYPYTLSPGNPPRRQDFVDYFLFEGKEGYCTYYASAMTVLLRCIDIPARYVEGYILPPENENGVFKVTNEQAHAWVEVYFEGFGWIPFEPTSPFVAVLYGDRTSTATVSTNMTDPNYSDYMAVLNKYRDPQSTVSFVSDDSTANTVVISNDTFLFYRIITLSVIVLILLFFCTLVAINRSKYYNHLRKIRNSDPNSAVLMAYEYILKLLSLQNISLNAGETPSQFGIRVEKQLDFNGYTLNKTNFIKITNHFVNARYSKINVPENDQQEMLEFIGILIRLTGEKMNKIKFSVYKYVLGKI